MAATVTNKLLQSLSPEARTRLMSKAAPVPLPLRFQLFEAGEVPTFAYFITSGLASVVTNTGNGATAEVSVVGDEGVIGALYLLGPAVGCLAAFMQIEGTGVRVPLHDLREASRQVPEIQDRLLEWLQVQTLTTCTTAGCNLLHGAEARLARWLLTANDRVPAPSLNLTQEFLGIMLGVRRTTVNLVVGALEERGLIRSERSRIFITDRAGLEGAACACYGITRDLHASLYRDVPQLVAAR